MLARRPVGHYSLASMDFDALPPIALVQMDVRPGRPDLNTGLRITVASTVEDHERLLSALDGLLEEAA